MSGKKLEQKIKPVCVDLIFFYIGSGGSFVIIGVCKDAMAGNIHLVCILYRDCLI